MWYADSTQIQFYNHTFFKINGKWWEVENIYKETLFTGSINIIIDSPKLIREINIDEIKKKYIRLKKIKRICYEIENN